MSDPVSIHPVSSLARVCLGGGRRSRVQVGKECQASGHVIPLSAELVTADWAISTSFGPSGRGKSRLRCYGPALDLLRLRWDTYSLEH